MVWKLASATVEAIRSGNPYAGVGMFKPGVRELVARINALMIQSFNESMGLTGPITPSERIISEAERPPPEEEVDMSPSRHGVNVQFEKTQTVLDSLLDSIRNEDHRANLRPVQEMSYTAPTFESELERKLEIKRKQPVDLQKLEDMLHNKRLKTQERLKPNDSAFAQEIRGEISRRQEQQADRFY